MGTTLRVCLQTSKFDEANARQNVKIKTEKHTTDFLLGIFFHFSLCFHRGAEKNIFGNIPRVVARFFDILNILSGIFR